MSESEKSANSLPGIEDLRPEELECRNFEDTIQLRVPRRWKVEAKNRVLGRVRFSVDEPNERETLWVHSTLQRVCGASEADRAQRFRRIAEDVADSRFPAEKGWIDPIYETLPSGDWLVRGEMRDTDEVGDLRTVTWMRLSLRSTEMITSIFQLCTGVEFLDAPEQQQSREMFEREIRSASILATHR